MLGTPQPNNEKRNIHIFNARNAKKIREEMLDKLFLDHILTEENFQAIILTYNSRDPENPNIIIWRPIYLIKENQKLDL
jgi:hypothetical protein